LRRLHLRLEEDIKFGLLPRALVARHGEGDSATRAREMGEMRLLAAGVECGGCVQSFAGG
jgi:hypothetical protein